MSVVRQYTLPTVPCQDIFSPYYLNLKSGLKKGKTQPRLSLVFGFSITAALRLSQVLTTCHAVYPGLLHSQMSNRLSAKKLWTLLRLWKRELLAIQRQGSIFNPTLIDLSFVIGSKLCLMRGN